MPASRIPSSVTEHRRVAPELGRKVEVETPELVEVTYELADLGSRFTALMIDGVILIAVLLAVTIGVPLLLGWARLLPSGSVSSVMAVLVLVNFLVTWGYFVYFEAFRDGQTPGKRRMGLRVVQDGGYPLSVRAALVRNLLRLVDSVPPPTFLLGGTAMMLHPQTKRVGDMAAGSVVVRERGEPALPEEAGGAEGVGPPRLNDAEFDMLARYLARRDDLPGDVRLRIGGQLVTLLVARLDQDPGRGKRSSDAFLRDLHDEETRRRAHGARAGTSFQSAQLVRRQSGAWREYRELVERVQDRGFRGVPEEDVTRFATLYRTTAADLARSRSYGASAELVYSLQRLVGAGHNLLYRPGAASGRSFLRWLARGFPALVRRRWVPVSIAAALLFGPMLATGAAVQLEPARARQVLPAEMLARAEEGAERQAAGAGYVEIPEMWMSMFATSIITNNVQVAILAFAGGVAAGLGTVVTLVFNGVSIGAAFGLFGAYGLSLHLLAFVLPHGVLELTAICIAGGAGLWLGSALIAPGRSTRRDALVVRGREAVSLLGGAAVMLVVAGLIEGFISPSPLPMAFKAAISATSAVLVAGYLVLGGRRDGSDDQSSP